MNETSLNEITLPGLPFRGREGLILAGGLGTRLRSVVSDLPKCMAPVAGRPFLFYVINYLRLQGVEKFIFSLGYKHEIIIDYLNDQFSTLNFQCSVEEEPLGTGGAIQLACQYATEKNVLIVNGDTLFKIDVDTVNSFHEDQKADCTLALKPMHRFDRYGVVEMNEKGLITDFKEKQFYDKGLINGGVYILNVENFLAKKFPAKFSFEKDYLERYYQQGKISGIVQDSYFIDIGIPEDYNRVQDELKQAPLNLEAIDQSWTLFLDRDGVLNHDKVGSYIFNPGEFVFYDGVPPVFKLFKEKFGRIVIATNQRGVGRNLMSVADLDAIHQKMLTTIEAEGGKIDAIFYASSIDNNDIIRKPNPGMALQARARFPEIDFSKSIMVGNNISDMEFGRNAGMYCIFLKTTIPHIELPHPAIDMSFNSLTDFAKAL
ncbi:HAD-IIIA family hydrolase [Terrimonas pollutisoli]|uniref:HAD-IIIA family hydrolase n=1 Tax=Terrimonas pollutisoli TaxID=3034147 RepID=UPI0023EC8A06|nr:HAD-IIIA family hydrolase [Terrimonas sp. H1YJ31]